MGGDVIQFQWNKEYESAFREPKDKLVSAPVLCPPDLTKHFFVWTATSLPEFVTVLEQLDGDSQRHPIAYASKQTDSAEQQYTPTQLEVAALVYTVEHFEVACLDSHLLCTLITSPL